MIAAWGWIADVTNVAAMAGFFWALTRGSLRRARGFVALALGLSAAATISSAWAGSGLTAYFSATAFVLDGAAWLVTERRLRTQANRSDGQL